MTRQLTIWIAITTCFALIAYNIVVYIEPTPGDTLSAVLRDYADPHPSIPTAIGVLCGHWFWPPRDRHPPYGVAVLLVWGTVFAALDWLGVLPVIPSGLSFIGGFALGALLWGRHA